MPTKFSKGDAVRKVTGDYKFTGIVIAVFVKLDKLNVRYVVENSDGILHIFSDKVLEAIV